MKVFFQKFKKQLIISLIAIVTTIAITIISCNLIDQFSDYQLEGLGLVDMIGLVIVLGQVDDIINDKSL